MTMEINYNKELLLLVVAFYRISRFLSVLFTSYILFKFLYAFNIHKATPLLKEMHRDQTYREQKTALIISL